MSSRCLTIDRTTSAATSAESSCLETGSRSGLTTTPPLNPAIGSVISKGSISIFMPRGGLPLVIPNRMPASCNFLTASMARGVRILSCVTSVPSTSAMTRRTGRFCGVAGELIAGLSFSLCRLKRCENCVVPEGTRIFSPVHPALRLRLRAGRNYSAPTAPDFLPASSTGNLRRSILPHALKAGAALHDPTVGKDGRSRYVTGAVPGEEGDHSGDFLRPSHTAQRDGGIQFGQ